MIKINLLKPKAGIIRKGRFLDYINELSTKITMYLFFFTSSLNYIRDTFKYILFFIKAHHDQELTKQTNMFYEEWEQ